MWIGVGLSMMVNCVASVIVNDSWTVKRVMGKGAIVRLLQWYA